MYNKSYTHHRSGKCTKYTECDLCAAQDPYQQLDVLMSALEHALWEIEELAADTDLQQEEDIARGVQAGNEAIYLLNRAIEQEVMV